MADVEVVYYLVHSMGGADDFETTELTIARNVAASAHEHGAHRIVYLGGLHPATTKLSRAPALAHAGGRDPARVGGADVVLQAGVIIGSGSTSFEMIRHLTEVLPYMPPRDGCAATSSRSRCAMCCIT